MTTVHSWICLILLWIAADTNGKTPDVQLTCTFSEDCVLPCVFEAAGDEIIYWFRQNVPIQSYIQGSGRLDQADQHYNSRTSLFTELIPSGNASLHIQKCGPQDRGKYRCLVTSSRETTEHFIIVKVEAPIQSVSLETTRLSGFEEVICSSRDVYPAPRVNLFTEPASLPDSLQPFTRKTADKQGLYSVESKLKKLKDLTYICLVQSFYRSQTWRASLQEKEIFSVEGQDFIIPCVAPWNLQNFTLTWSFTKEHKSTTIYTYDSLTQQSSSVWKKVRLVTPRGRGGDGSLQLHNPLSLKHTGTYTCILAAHQTKHEVHTRVNIRQTKYEVHSRVSITEAQRQDHTRVNITLKPEKQQSESSPQWWITAAVITGIAVTAVAAILGIIKCKAGCTKSSNTHAEATEMQPIRVTAANSRAASEDACLTEEIANRPT
ncbi:HERV-H LTR-associating protein 2 [Carassius carassius]|uniref:HERV-H LTR-associating protein 2 n=1 Tax=Carassius carassius TaxID=217509 RepID=UPI0028685BCA|nr:HERV-H LTR-associating protein 2 [Carassius carassius]